MKAQGLPINFIVIAALAILILILVVGFVVAGGSSFTKAVSPAQARANCQTICSELQREASQKDSSVGVSSLKSYSKWCTGQDIKGMGTDITCPELGETCYVTFNDSIQKLVTCS